MSDNLQKYPDPKYDVFIAHNSLDGDQVDELVQQLESRGVRVCHPERDFFPGKLVTENMASAIALSRKTATFLTKNFLASDRCKQERAIAEQKAIKSKQHVIVDILVDIGKDQLPDWLLVTTYVEIKSPHFFKSLLTALEVSSVEARVEKTYEDLVEEIASLTTENVSLTANNASLTADNASLYDENQLAVKTLKQKEQSWMSEKQALLEQIQGLTSKLDQFELKQKQSVQNENDTGQKEQVKRRKGLSLEKNNQTVVVKRHEKKQNMEVDISSVPVHWTPIPAGQTRTGVFLPPYTEECQEVVQRFWRTAGELGGGFGGIYRIQNPSLYQAYQAKKYELSPDMREEYTLYYGISGWEQYLQIGGRGFSGNNANNFNSAGICFTTTSQVAIQNIRRYYGCRYIIAAKVLPGRSCVQANMVTSGQGVPACYDSVVDNVDNPSWVRIKDARQAYPEYMIPYYD